MRTKSSSRVGVCQSCGMKMLIHRSDCKTCSPKCRKRLQRKSQLEALQGEPMIVIDGVSFPARLVNMFTVEEFEKQTGLRMNAK